MNKWRLKEREKGFRVVKTYAGVLTRDDRQELCRQPGGAKMAQWQYATLCTELKTSANFDAELQKILKNYGMNGWELVQVLQPGNDSLYHLIFKTQRSLYPSLEPVQTLSAGDN